MLAVLEEGILKMDVPVQRKVRPILAFLANFVSLGLGYVYVGEPRLAAIIVGGYFGLWAFFSWTRLIVSSVIAYWFLAGLAGVVMVVSVVHPAVIAFRNRRRPQTRYNRWWFYLLWILAIGTLAYSAVQDRAEILGYEPFRTPTESMSPTLERGDFFMADTWHFHHHPPMLGEIVVFERPDEPHVKYVKRVVAVPGDTIKGRNGVLYRNGQVINEPYVHAPNPDPGYARDFGPNILGKDDVFVLGDYRNNSLDSRTWGAIPIRNLHGRAQFVWFSWGNAGVRWNRLGISLRR